MGQGRASGAPTLYQQLGGREGVRRLAARLVERSASDPRTAAALRHARRDALQHDLAVYLCEVADGPCVFREGPPGRYGRLALTEASFAVMMATLREELQAARVPLPAQAELLRRLAPPQPAVIAADPPP